MIYQRNMENKKNCTLNENTNTSSLPVVFSEKLENKIQDVINYNKHNKDGISEWAKSLEYLSKYLSQRQIAFDYGGQHNYDRYEENETITITKIHYVTYKIIEDKNGRIYVEIVGAKLKPLDYGLEIPPSFTESKETSNQYISLRDYITEYKYINTTYKMKSLQEYINESRSNIEAKIKAIKELAKTHSYFTIPDNCPGDGWDGRLTSSGAYCFGNNHFEGEFFKYEDMDEELLDTILDEAEFND